jgi:hypothetical protein
LFAERSDPPTPDPNENLRRHPIVLDLISLSGDEATLLVVEGATPRSDPVRLMINTGSWEAELTPSLAIGVAAKEESRGLGIGGTEVRGVVTRHGRLTIGGALVRIPELILREQRSHLDGQLGMQVLGGTCLDIHTRERRLFWSVPKHWLLPSVEA